ncbi:DUF4013 domain-containing protein [Cerasicoccus arenae]|uniref:DUF4013 domain-containing protein n=1 Tax=Cerasicoccus arenae TaxID=424488 RepID=A0A8J3GE68_9BACT|nr:DUF4013 domain-containing protein [Cerasicoccus arenae]MBK1858190.1 DUF4013 domain-containing protein [Cerasicoccus arenae]GHC00942.1 hypothetical protein GCM10007047_16630 [Cerasicoccus arenae]
MASIEQIGERIFRQEDSWKRLLIGGALCLTVFGLPLAFGYLFVYSFNLKKDPEAPLPPWDNWSRMFIVGLHGLAVFLAWVGIPLAIACLLTWLFGMAPGSFLDIFSWLARAVAFVVGLPLFASALIHYQREHEWKALADFEAICRPVEKHWKALILPGVAWCGLMAIGLPLLPFTFFLGMVVFLAYAIPLLSQPIPGKAPKI